MTHDTDICEIVRKIEQQYINGSTTISKYVEFNQYENINKIEDDVFYLEDQIKNIKNRVFIQTVDGEHVPNYAGKKAWEENIENNKNPQYQTQSWKILFWKP